MCVGDATRSSFVLLFRMPTQENSFPTYFVPLLGRWKRGGKRSCNHEHDVDLVVVVGIS